MRLRKYGVDGEEVARQDRVGLGGQELFPGWSGSPRCRVDAGVVQDLPHRAGRDPVAQAEQFTLDAPVAPGGVLGGESQYQVADLFVGRWPAGACMRVCPVSGDQLSMPTK
jgi:hypothetical protein